MNYLIAIPLFVASLFAGFVGYQNFSEPQFGATPVSTTAQGGTGTSSPSGILYGDNGATPRLKTVAIGSGLSFAAGTLSATGGSGSGGLGTTSPWTGSGLAYRVSEAAVSTVATTTVTASSPLSLSNPVAKVGGSNSVLSIDTSGTWSGNAGTATALAANGANCSAGNAPLGVDASGAVESCFDVWTQAENTSAAYIASVTADSPLSGLGTSASHLVIANAAADGSTKGAASFTANDFDASSGNISIDYTNGQAASASNKGFLTSSDWTTFNNKISWPWTVTPTYSTSTNATTTPTWYKTAFFASSTIANPSVIDNLVLTNGTSTNATSTNLYVSGQTRLASLSGFLKGTSGVVSTALVGVADLASDDFGSFTCNGSACTVDSQAITAAMLANADFGNFTVSGGVATIDNGSVTNAMLANSTISGIALGNNLANLTATDSTLTFSGTYTGATARTIGLNLGNANTWTALQQFSQATSTMLSGLQAWFGATGTTTISRAGFVGIASSTPTYPLSINTIGTDFYVDTTGKIVGYDVANAWNGRITPTRNLSLFTATTTTWTASTTGSAYTPFAVAPFAGTLRGVQCKTDASFLGVTVQIDGASVTPSYLVASTTVGTVLFTGSNTFSKGAKISMDVGTTTTSLAKSISCTISATET